MPPTPVPPAAPRRLIYRDLVLLQLAALVFLLDQFSKFLVRQTLELRESFPVDGFARITHTYNTGSAFGLFQGYNAPLIFVSFLGIVILVLLYRTQSLPLGLLRLSLGLQLGGAVGNLLDRVRLGYVTDWIDIGPWPVFNIADSCIVTGLVILAWLFFTSGRSPSPQAAAAVSAYDWCPLCDGEMRALPEGWRCTSCGARERRITRPPDGRR